MSNYYVRYKVGSRYGLSHLGNEYMWFDNEETAWDWCRSMVEKYGRDFQIIEAATDELATAFRAVEDAGGITLPDARVAFCEDERLVTRR